jgi:hypothetical protein
LPRIAGRTPVCGLARRSPQGKGGKLCMPLSHLL